MRGFGPTSYGEAFADVYDEWYGDISDGAATVATVAALARGPVLELGAGTGRLALPLAATGVEVWALDASAPMLARLRAKDGDRRVRVVLGDMAAPPLRADGRFAMVLCAYNTFFNLHTADAQRACLRWCGRALAPDGRLAIEAFVPDPSGPGGERMTVRSIEPGRVVLSVADHDPGAQVLTGQFVELAASGVRRRPYRVRYLSPGQLDEMAAAAGLVTADRWSSWARDPFAADSPNHVSVYRAA